MNKKLSLALLAMLIIPIAGATTVFERAFSEMGYEDFSIDRPASTGCTSVSFVFPSDKNAFAEENYPVVSLNAEFSPTVSEAAKIDANLNGNQIIDITKQVLPAITMKSTDFKCNENDCWYRIWLPKQMLKSGTNRLDICLKSSNSTPDITLKNSSKIGLYMAANFFAEDAFITTTEKQEVLIGEKLKVTVNLHNAGSDSAQVELKYARPIAEEKKAFVFIEGKAYASGIVNPGEDLTIEYTIKPRVLGPITLPPAAVYFKNEFGEEQTIFSSLASFKVREPEKKIDAFISKEKEINPLGEKAKISLNIKNNGRDIVYNIEASLELPEGLGVEGQNAHAIDSIAPGETKTIAFEATASKAGTFDIGCKLAYVDLNKAETKCQNSKIVFESMGISTELLAAIVLVLLGIGVYAYLMKSK